MLRDAVVLAEVLRAASPPQTEYAVVTTNAARAKAAVRLKSEGYVEIREGRPGSTQFGLRLTPLGLALRTKLQRSSVLGLSGSPQHST
jgi:hypothetical protein